MSANLLEQERKMHMRDQYGRERFVTPVTSVPPVKPIAPAEEKTAASALNVDRLLLLFQRRYNILREIKNDTDDLAEATSRHDGVSADLELEMRMDHLQQCEDNWQQICLMGETDAQAAAEFRRLVLQDPENVHSSLPKEEKLYDLRRKCRMIIRQIQAKDRIVNLQSIHEKSVYYQP